jgi:putative phosphoribosyl transferase
VGTYTPDEEASARMADVSVRIPAGAVRLEGDLSLPEGATGVIAFVHGSGSSRLSPRNAAVAAYLRETGRFGTLLFDLLTEREDTVYETRFDIRLLAERLAAATEWLRSQDGLARLPLGYFGASTGAAAALVAASQRDDVAAVVSRGGRPDLAGGALAGVSAPTLLIVGGDDTQVIELNRRAMAAMPGVVELSIVPGATHLFEEPGALDEAARLTRGWFERYLG